MDRVIPLNRKVCKNIGAKSANIFASFDVTVKNRIVIQAKAYTLYLYTYNVYAFL